MFAPDIEFIGFTATEYGRLLEAVRPQTPGEGGTRGPGVILVNDGKQLLKLLSTRDGRLDPHSQPWPEALPEVASRHGARWVLQLHFGALQAMFERFSDSVCPEDDGLAQILRLLELAREYEAQGRLKLWPQRLGQWPVPSPRTAHRALDAICPVGQVLLFGVFRRGHLYTCLAARRSQQGFDRVLGPSQLRPRMGLVSGDWTRDYRHLLRAAEQRVGPVSVGCFAELATLQGLAAARRPGAWAQAVALREVILTPVVPALAIPLSLDVGLAALEGVKALAGRAKAADWLAPEGLVAELLGRVQTARRPSGTMKSILGFDPMLLLYKLVEKRSPRE